MAKSPSHKFGQIIGELLEAGIDPILREFAVEHKLFLDKKGERDCRPGRKCTWKDRYENSHDLDYVLERDGSPGTQGTPVAFIEVAWRRYTKHSRNKAQEIQGAILPLVETHKEVAPFKGAILAGDFTAAARAQLKSHGFNVIYIPYSDIVSTFSKFKINAHFDEDTSDAEFEKKVDAYTGLSPKRRDKLAKALLDKATGDVTGFMSALKDAVLHQVERVVILPLYGTAHQLPTVNDAIEFVESYKFGESGEPFVRYEIQVYFVNNDRAAGEFSEKGRAIQFLRYFLPHV